jgi:hypothetical protein
MTEHDLVFEIEISRLKPEISNRILIELLHQIKGLNDFEIKFHRNLMLARCYHVRFMALQASHQGFSGWLLRHADQQLT